MKMKFAALTLAMASLFTAGNALASDGTINFTGLITDDACEIDTGTTGSIDVNMGEVARTSLPAAGEKSSPTTFKIMMKNCPASVKGATVKFDGTGYTGDTSVLALTEGTDTAKGVAIEISDNSNAKVPLYAASSSYKLEEGDNNLPFVARYIAMTDNVTAGPANAVAQFTLNYER